MTLTTAPRKFRVTAANMTALKEAIEALNETWSNMETDVDAWLEFQEDPPMDADSRDDRRAAREVIDDNIDTLRDNIDTLNTLIPTA